MTKQERLLRGVERKIEAFGFNSDMSDESESKRLAMVIMKYLSRGGAVLMVKSVFDDEEIWRIAPLIEKNKKGGKL